MRNESPARESGASSCSAAYLHMTAVFGFASDLTGRGRLRRIHPGHPRHPDRPPILHGHHPPGHHRPAHPPPDHPHPDHRPPPPPPPPHPPHPHHPHVHPPVQTGT